MKPILLLAFSIATACRASAGNAAPPPAAAGASVNESAAQAPLIVRWQVKSDNGSRLQITAIVIRRASLRVPVEVRVEVPEGLQLTSGQTTFTIEPNLPPGETTTPLEFQYSAPPQGDLKVVASVSGNGMGVHAADSYRFGRPAPSPPRPQPSGQDIKFGNVNLGPAVPLDAK